MIPYQEVRICRDPKDNKFLEVAVAGEVDFLVSGDLDLLELTSFEKISIIKPAEFFREIVGSLGIAVVRALAKGPRALTTVITGEPNWKE